MYNDFEESKHSKRLDIRKLCTFVIFVSIRRRESGNSHGRDALRVARAATRNVHEVFKTDAQLIPRMVIEWRMGKGSVNRVTCNGSIRGARTHTHTGGDEM